MKILLATSRDVWKVSGGLASAIRNLSKSLRELGHEVDIISFDGTSRVFRVITRLTPYVMWAVIFKTLLFPFLILVRCSSKLYEVINVHDFESSLFAWPANRIFKIPIVLTIHGPTPSFVGEEEWRGLPLGKKVYLKLAEAACRVADVIIIPSKSEKNLLVTLGEIYGRKTVIVSNGVDLDTIQKSSPIPLEGEPSVLYVGSLEWYKGVDLLIRAFRKVKDVLPRGFLHVIGDGSKRKEYELLAASLQIPNVIFHGAIVPAYAYFKGADIVVVPSRVEAFGIVALEAMAAGKSVVVSNVGGLKELVKDFENGVLVSPTPGDIAEKIIMVWRNLEFREKLSNNAVKLARRYEWKNIAKDYLEVFESYRKKEVQLNIESHTNQHLTQVS